MEPIDYIPENDLELQAVFPENHFHATPFEDGGILPSPQNGIIIPLPNKESRPRVVIADDDPEFFNGLARSLEAHYSQALDVRFWRPDNSKLNLVDQIIQWIQEGWRPDAVVIDINMGDGGRHGVHYLQEIRKQKGCATLAVILATGNQYRDLDEGRLTAGANLTKLEPSKWLEMARKHEPELILYGKTADAQFLGRIGEHLPEWQRAARRRGWIKLLGEVARILDGATIKKGTVAKKIVKYAVAELGVDYAFVRWRREDDNFELIAAETTQKQLHVTIGEKIKPEAMPILEEILKKTREPVIKGSLTEEESGIFAQFIAKHRFLGVGMVLGYRSVGFIILLRSPNKQVFKEDVDGKPLTVLARLLASALGREALMRARQTQLLDFANSATRAIHEEEVCKTLVKTLHHELHGNENAKSKTTVRLLDFGKGVLKRKFLSGMNSIDKDISITDTNSIYAESVRDDQIFRIDDVCKPKWKERFKNLCVIGGVRSELCIPMKIGKHAIGAVNLEHLDTDFYRIHDEGFVQSAAGLAASAIERIQTTRVLNGMADFVYRFAHNNTDSLDKLLRDLLYEFCGYSVLVDLKLNDTTPWSVTHVETKFHGTNKDEFRNQIQAIYSEQWRKTWVSKLYQRQDWNTNWASFTKDMQEFVPVPLAKEDGQDVYQKADALLWLKHGNAVPHRALLLMWYLPPPMNETGMALMGSLARLFSELDNRQHHIRSLIDKNLIGEQAAQIGYVMQHFRHRLGNLTGSLTTHIDRVADAHQHMDEHQFEEAMNDLRDNARDIANSFHKSRGYIKVPEETTVLLQDLIDKTLSPEKLAGRLRMVDVHIEIPAGLKVYTDIEIASLVLFSLLENSLDAFEGVACPRMRLRAESREDFVVLSISDNGSGLSESIRAKLFEWGTTSKPDGLGSALAFARARMQLLNGDLLFPPYQPSIGALFEIWFPSKSKRVNP